MATNYDQQHFAFYNDNGSEATATINIAGQDANITLTVNADQQLTLRIAEANTGTTAAGQSFQLQLSKNAGAYANITTSSSNVKAYNSANLTDQGATTHRLTGASGIFVAGGVSLTGVYDNSGSLFTLPTGDNTEFLFTLQLIAANLANSDTLDFRIQGLTTYTKTPRITVVKVATFYTPPLIRSFALSRSNNY